MATNRSSGEVTVRFRTALELGVLVRDTREAREWTQTQLAQRANVGRQWLSAIEGGRHSHAEIGMLMRVLSSLGIELFARVQKPRVNNADTDAERARSAAGRPLPAADLDSLIDEMTGGG